MNEQAIVNVLTAVITVILGGGGFGAWTAYRKQRAGEPIEEETAAVLNARTAGELALAVAQQQQTLGSQQQQSIEVLREDLRIVRVDLDNTRKELSGLRTTLNAVVPWIRDLFEHWDHHRMQPSPPDGLPSSVLW